MKDKFNAILSYVKHFVNASTIHNVHSPFLFELLLFMFDPENDDPAFAKIEAQRQKLLSNSQKITLTDFGAGSAKNNAKRKTISEIARSALSPAKQCRAMFRIAKFLEAKNILEMGTSLGISTMYLAAEGHRHVTAMEGDLNILEYAKGIASALSLPNIEFIEGPFVNTLPKVVDSHSQMDLIFIDGHHAEKPTIQYFEMLQPLVHDNTVIIVDDIYWSKGMQNAWEVLKDDGRITQSVDLFYYGILFFRKEFLAKEHLVFR